MPGTKKSFDRQAAMGVIITRLERLAFEQKGLRQNIEDRMIEDVRQYAGIYPSDVINDLEELERSMLYLRMTKQKTDSWAGRLGDMLFPTDDKNWAIDSTPAPTDAHGNPIDIKDAKAIAGKMSTVINDQLIECRYPVAARRAIRDACLLGTGVLKLMRSAKSKMKWGKSIDGPMAGKWVAGQVGVNNKAPALVYVSPWDYFPDMSASSVDDSEFHFQRHLMNISQMRDLAKIEGFDAEAISDLLEIGPRETSPTYLSDIQELAGVTANTNNRFLVWEYHGTFEPDEMADVCLCLEGEDAESVADKDVWDVLDNDQFIIWFCQGKLLKIGIHPLDSQEPMFYTFVFDENHGTIFGDGIPAILRDTQSSANATWRMLHDNAALAVSPQVVVDPSIIEPENGDWNLTPGKIWKKRVSSAPIDAAFRLFPTVGNQSELMALHKMAMEIGDQEVNLPMVAQGESGAHQTQTAQGMGMLVNAASIGFKRVVKIWDDNITEKIITHIYEWNMMHNDLDDIKGDFSVDARGASALLAKELQAQNLMMVLTNFSAHPVIGPMIKSLEILRALFQSYSMSSDLYIKSDEELAQEQEAAAQAAAEGGGQVDPEQIKLQIAQMNADTQIQKSTIERETAMLRVAAEQNQTLEQIRAQMTTAEKKTQADALESQAQRDHTERLTAVEMATMERKNMQVGFISQ